MTEPFDFDRAWMEKFQTYLDEMVGEEIREVVIRGGETLSADSSRLEVIEWTQQAMERLDSLVDERTSCSILSACACQYPKANLQEMKSVYASGSCHVSGSVQVIPEEHDRRERRDAHRDCRSGFGFCRN